MKDVNILKNAGINVDKSLELFGDMQTYDETLRMFLDEVDSKKENLKNYKETGDMANYAIVVHGLKSEYRYLGFEEIGELCYKHELESKANNLFFISDDFDKLIEEIDKTIILAKTYFGESVEIKKDVESKPKDKKILIVDDSNIIVNFINKIADDNYEVVTAGDGKVALDIIAEDTNFAAMLLDLNMPNFNGFVVLEYFKRANLFEKIPVSIITGLGNEDIIEQAFQYPIIDVLRKPFNERDLKLVLDKTINCLK
ncbi:MAG: response regulator [Firmicutes bacterium]|nr:response regulator [Bacillota bacterium]